MMSSLLAFAVVAGLLTMVPGLDTALIVRAAVTLGRRAAFATLAGISAGVLAWGVAAAAGISALLTASQTAYTVVRLAGAVYLMWMGLRLMWATRGNRLHTKPTASGPTAHSAREAFRRGLVTNLLNPKVGVFYMAMLPQFVPAGYNVLAAGALLALVHVLEGVAWYSALIAGSHVMRVRLARPNVRLWTDRVTGLALAGLGAKVAFAHG